MRNLSLVILALMAVLFGIYSQISTKTGLSFNQPDYPHGPNFNVSCSVCHSTKGWGVLKESNSFNHDLTQMPLIGQHVETDCKQCHPTLIFTDAKKECAQCHTDVHESTVGKDCDRCHTPHSWLVNNATQIHQQSRFPLVGVHSAADCNSCHKSETFSRFDVLGTECVNCHREEYAATTQPNHLSVGYSTQCDDCHNVFSKEWKGTGFNHNSFPLTLGHALPNCNQCHTDASIKLSTDCISCHQVDYNNTTNPKHAVLNFSNNCTECHTTDPDWKPAKYLQHDAISFPIYSGKHNGEWSNCTDCHTNSANYKDFTCLDCHEHNKSDMDDKHSGENGYSYNSTACFTCHPRGSED